MPDPTDHVQKRLDELRSRLEARDGQKHFAKNVEALRREIARLEAVQRAT